MFEEGSEQGDIFRGIGLGALIEGVVFGGGEGGGGGGRDGLLATLGVTGSGKVGSFCQRVDSSFVFVRYGGVVFLGDGAE